MCIYIYMRERGGKKGDNEKRKVNEKKIRGIIENIEKKNGEM